MKREVISIDEELCNGCGQCIPNCPEGALQIINGKVRLISDLYCDGLGACVGHCPQNAIAVEKREAEPYSESKVMENIINGGKDVIIAHLRHLKDHNQEEYLNEAKQVLNKKKIIVSDQDINGEEHELPCGCPGSAAREIKHNNTASNDGAGVKMVSELRQWPIQLQLLNPHAPYFKDADIVIAADCVPFSYANFHSRFLKGKIVIIFCPKLDGVTDQYVEKLAEIIKNNNVKSISVVHMEVPCCFGTESIVEQAIANSGKNIPIKEYTISVQGEIV